MQKNLKKKSFSKRDYFLLIWFIFYFTFKKATIISVKIDLSHY
jgi:hypothetical protein